MDDAGRQTRYARDRAGRVLTTRFADGSAYEFDYDAAGRLVRAESRDAVVSYAYDRAGRVTEEWQELLGVPDGGDVAGVERGPLAVRYGHDARGRLTATRLPDGREVAIEYGAGEGGAWAAVALGGEQLARVERDEVGREVARQAGAVRQEQAYDPEGRLARQAGTTARGAAVFRRAYGYDPADQITRIDDQARGVRTYQYDACERLLAVGGGAPERFVVDPAGNILARDAGGGAGAPKGGDVAPGDRLLRYRDGAEERTFTYDAWGNRVGERRTSKAGVVDVAYAYDAGDVLREVRMTERGGARVVRFGYDALGRRVWKATARATSAAPELPDDSWTRTAFVWSGDVLAGESERPDDDALATAYIYEPGSFTPLTLAKRDGAAAAVYRYHVDQLGTPQELTGADGTVAWRAAYTAWGVAEVSTLGRVVQPLRFQGQYSDAETGLSYNFFRYYSPREGRFVQQDPVRLFGGDNLSAYVGDPTAEADPLGLMPWRWNPDGMGHHLVYRQKVNSVGLTHLGTIKDTPTYFPDPYSAGMHEELHRAQDPHVGGRSGAWTGTPDELLTASRKGLADLPNMRGDLKIPRTGEVLASKVSPTQAFDKLMEWHREQTARPGGGSCSM